MQIKRLKKLTHSFLPPNSPFCDAQKIILRTKRSKKNNTDKLNLSRRPSQFSITTYFTTTYNIQDKIAGQIQFVRVIFMPNCVPSLLSKSVAID